MNIPIENKIVVAPIGEMDASMIARISKDIERQFGFRTESLSILYDITFALDPGRGQYNSTMILERLSDLLPGYGIKILAICNVDLFIPIMTHVYGEAQLGGKSCIISTYRLQTDLGPMNIKDHFQERVLKEAIHELGHTFRLRHCPDRSCSMHYCRTINDVDRKSKQLCRYCRVLLEDEKKRLFDKGISR